jgi:hypothetical protein
MIARLAKLMDGSAIQGVTLMRPDNAYKDNPRLVQVSHHRKRKTNFWRGLVSIVGTHRSPLVLFLFLRRRGPKRTKARNHN